MITPPVTTAERLRAARRVMSNLFDAVRVQVVPSKNHKRRLRDWQTRIDLVTASPDHAFIPRVPDAGKIVGGMQIMHNGIRIRKGSYYGWRGTSLFAAARGVHEPQEERVFAEVLKFIPPGGVIVELGAYWGFYSMWFATKVKDARCILVEPRLENLDLGRDNFLINNLSGEFVRAGVGATSGHIPELGAMICVDDLVEQKKLDHIDILHVDIQGFEGDMMRGAVKTLTARKVRFAFISTHNQPVHDECRKALLDHGFEIIAEADMDGTYSVDGLIAAKLPDVPGPAPIAISQRPKPA